MAWETSPRKVSGGWLQHLSSPQCTGGVVISSNLGWGPSHWRDCSLSPQPLFIESGSIVITEAKVAGKAIPRPSGCTSPGGNELLPVGMNPSLSPYPTQHLEWVSCCCSDTSWESPLATTRNGLCSASRQMGKCLCWNINWKMQNSKLYHETFRRNYTEPWREPTKTLTVMASGWLSLFFYLFLERGKGRKEGRKRNINM